ncbi:MAG: hypothetical protein LBQ95_05440 [Lachnospiraceae bacterium]|jgi:hypothetical protein|nr:hypothetical protein [Lachnospiraceae bacterium]
MDQFNIKIGTAKKVIPYPENIFPYHSWGPRRLTGVHDDLHVRVIYLSEPSELLVVSVENGDIDPVWVEKLSKAAGVSTDNILITVSHTHTAPFIGGYWPEDVEDVEKSEQYKLLAWETLIEAVKEAMAKAEPVILRYAEGYCDVNICRDNPQIDPETGKTLWRIGRNFKGYSDKTVYTISFEREDGTIAAVLFNYSVHSAVLFDAKMTKGGQLASGDLSGFAMDSVEKALGHEAVAIFTMAPAADQNAKYTAAYTYTGENGQKQNGNYGESSYVLVELQGRDLGEATLAAITQPKTVYHAEQIKTVSETIFVPGKIKKEGRGAKWPESPDEYELSEPVPIPLSVTAIGNLAIVGIGCETSSKNSPEIRKVLAQEGFTDTIIITQCNGSSSYMSDADGYQVVTFSAKASHMMPEAVDILFSSIKRLAAKSAGKNL